MENKKCWCYVTYAFLTDEMPPLPFPRIETATPANAPEGFEPTWFLNAKFPEDED